MSNVEKLKKKAADFEAKRQIDKAIATYLELFRVWDNGDIADVDVALYNRVGDLLLREGNVGDAMSVWEKAVDYYGESGFHNNAIALCNKILRHSPGRTSIYYKLGKISAQKGFKGDAKKNYLEYADRMQKSNNMDEAFRALKEFADLCPDEDDIRQMLADQLSKAGRKAEAVEQLQVLYERYDDAGDSDAAAATVERMKELDPGIEPTKGAGPRRSKETSGLVFLDLGDAPSGRPSRRSTTAMPQPAAPPPPRQSKKTAAPPPPAKAAAPPPPKAAPPPRKTVPTSQRLTGDIPLIDLDDDPPAPPPVARVEGLEVAPEAPRTPTPAEGEQMDVTFGASFGTEGSEPGDAKPLAGLESTSFPEATGPGGRVTASLSSAADMTFGTLGSDDLTLDDPNALGVGEPVFNTPPETIESIAPAAPTLPPANVIPDPMPELTLADATETADPDAEPAPTFDGGSLPLIDMDVAAEPAAEPEAPRRSAPRSTMSVLAQSVDLLRDRVANEPNNWQAHRELGEAMLEDGDRSGGLDQLESAMVGFESDDDLESARSLADEIIRLNPHSIRHHQKRVEYAVRMGDRARLIEAYIELADALFRAGQADKSKSVYQRVLELAPDDARALAALETFGEPEEVAPPPVPDSRRSQHTKRYTAATPIENLQPVPPPPKPAAVSSDYVDLENWLTEDDAPKSTRMVVEEQEPTGDEDADFADMLRKFKQGVAANVDEEDHESHYDLGVAYKEMGLVDEAIAEFQKALRGAHNRVRAYEALGQCFVERGQDQVAMTILQRALTEPGVTDDQLIGVLYLLGGAAEGLKHPADAVKYYQRVFAVDIKFRDVQKRMRALESAAR